MFAKKRVIEIVNKGPYAPLSNYCVESCIGMEPFKTVTQIYYHFIANEYPNKQYAIIKTHKISDIMEIMGPELYGRCSIIPQFNAYFNYHNTYTMLWTFIEQKLHNNRALQRLLLGTGDAELLMMCGTDSVLGIGKGRRGYNMSGLILMGLRDHYHRELIVLNMIKPISLKIEFNQSNESTERDECSELNILTDLFDDTQNYEFCVTPTYDIQLASNVKN